MDIRTKIILSAFFHDIGKFQQRGIPLTERLKHQEYSSAFVNGLFKDELINLLVRNHHVEDIRISNMIGEKRILSEIICEADNLASGERNPDTAVKSQQPLESIFTNINYGKDENPVYFQNISDIIFNTYQFPVNHGKAEELENSYAVWWNKYFNEINSANKNEIETLINITQKYLWCIPSSSYKTRSDVSLFEHSKITSGLAVSLNDFLIEKYERLDKINVDDIRNREEERYLLILADITGIQKYIYNIGHKGAAKALKGRSFYIQQMLDNIAYWIIDEKFNLPITNLIYSSGGKFYILAPKTQLVIEKINEIQRELEHKFLIEYEGNLGIILGKIALTGKDLEYDPNKKEHIISIKWDMLNKIVERNKKKKLSENWGYSLFTPQGNYGELIKCISTGKELINEQGLSACNKSDAEIGESKYIKYSNANTIFYQLKDELDNPIENSFISQEQFKSQQLGLLLKRENNTIVIRDYLKEFSVLDINSFELINNFNLVDNEAKKVRHFLINDIEFLKKLKGNSQKGIKFYGGDWYLKEFEEIITKGIGIERLGVLRIDVDNLGLIFKDGFGKKATFGRVVQLSAMLDFFFSNYINKIVSLYWDPFKGVTTNNTEYKLKELLQVVYSGGDDLFIVGHWSVLPDVAIWINKEFKKFTCYNSYFSISGGIFLFEDKYPLYKAAMEAGEYESNAKKRERKNRIGSIQKTKNGICFLDKETPISWKDFEIISNYVKQFYKWIVIGKANDEGEFQKISKGIITRLYFIYNEYIDGKYQNWAKWRWRAAYSLSRFGRQYKIYQKEIENFSAELFTSEKTEQELIQLLFIIANWTELLIRNKENK
jgi:CRISPR-associated protein Csm1